MLHLNRVQLFQHWIHIDMCGEIHCYSIYDMIWYNIERKIIKSERKLILKSSMIKSPECALRSHQWSRILKEVLNLKLSRWMYRYIIHRRMEMSEISSNCSCSLERDLWGLRCGSAFVDFFLFEVELYSLLIIDEDIIDWNSSNGPKVGVT